MKKFLVGSVLAISVAFSANAWAADGPYEVVEHDGSYIVSKDGGKTQAAGRNGNTIFNKKDDAEALANKLNRQQKKRDKREEK
jgi:hypothetical protein